MFNSNRILSYCTNVHAGTDYVSTLKNLETYAVAVKALVSPDGPMGVGLWLPASTAREILDNNRVGELREWLEARGLCVVTMNGFPYGDFHQSVVKHDVYLPTWAQEERLDYTMQLVRILGGLLPKDAEGSISTLPISWPTDDDSQVIEDATNQLLKLCDFLAREEAATGHCIHIDIEPEPGCLLDTTAGMIAYFEEHLYHGGDKKHIGRYLRVCHDVCHAAVMGEEQAAVMEAYRDAGVRVGKIQLSSAVEVDFTELSATEQSAALAQLAQFQEPRYLHQTMVDNVALGYGLLYEDLPEALDVLGNEELASLSLRTHFHVPIYLDDIGHLHATQRDVVECLENVDTLTDCQHIEVETYAWNVLPEELRVDNLAEGIAREMQWVLDVTSKLTESEAE